MRRLDFAVDPEIARSLTFCSDVYIVDSTIRSLQSGISGSRHTAKDLVDVGVALDGLGVRELIVNLSWKDGLTVCDGLAAAGLSARVVGTFRARHAMAAQWTLDGLRAGADEICFESCLDGDHLRRLAEPVLSRGKRVSHAFAEGYGSQAIVELCRQGALLGVSSQSFHDSFFRFGLIPESAKHFYRSLRSAVLNCPALYIHLSNFYGNATMTAVAAITAGASAADVCMNGIGHHGGHISLAEIVMVLEALYGVRTGIRLDRLRDVSLLVRERTGIPMPLPSPLVGDYAFILDGAYWAAEAHLPYAERVHATFPIPPDQVGNVEQVIWSDNTITPESIKAKLLAMGTTPEHIEESVVRDITADLRSALGRLPKYPKWLSDPEFERLCLAAVERRKRGLASSSEKSAP